MNNRIIIITAAAVVLVGAVAAVASYTTKQTMESENAKIVASKPAPKVVHQRVASAQPAAQALPPCDDKNIVGTLAGGVAGGVVGSQIGNGSGKTAATIAGAAGGALLGNQYIPTRNATCR